MARNEERVVNLGREALGSQALCLLPPKHLRAFHGQGAPPSKFWEHIEAGIFRRDYYLRGPLPGQSLVFFFGGGLEESPDTTEQCAS